MDSAADPMQVPVNAYDVVMVSSPLGRCNLRLLWLQELEGNTLSRSNA
jgi:hypothetical protein